MQTESTLTKLQTYFAAGVAVALVAGITYALSSPSPQDFDVRQTSQIPATSPVPVEDSTPAPIEPALRALDGVTYHG